VTPSSRPGAFPRGSIGAHAVQVLDDGDAGVALHVRSLAEGLGARGLRVTVCAPPSACAAGRGDAPGRAQTVVLPVPGPRTEPETVLTLRRICDGADIVHAHGVRAGILAALALRGRRRRPSLVLTWHARDAAPLLRLLERRAFRAASVVLGATTELVDAARRHGARDARLAPVGLPRPLLGPAHEGPAPKLRAEIGAVDRPLLLAVAPLRSGHGHRTALAAARAWRHLGPPPLLAIAGEGPLRGALQARIDAEELPVRLLGRRDDVAALLAEADVALACGRSQTRPLFAEEALHAGTPLLVAAASPAADLAGAGALAVPYGDADALAAAVSGLLADPDRRAALAAAGTAAAAARPTEATTLAHVLSVYDELTTAHHRPASRR
jgi:glycosyltransferase involved in cell wall biosynthesis